MPSMRRHAIGLAAVLLATAPIEVAGGFMKQFSKGVTNAVGDIKDKVDELPLDKVTAEKVAKTLEKREDKVVGTIKDTVNRTVTEVVSSAEKTVEHSPNVTEVLDATAAGRKEIAGALQAASDSLSQGASAVSNASSTGVQSTIQDTKPRGAPAIMEALRKGKGEGLAEALHGAAPEMAIALNKTGMQIAKAITEETPKVAGRANSTGLGVAKMLGAKDHKAPLGSERDGEEGANLVEDAGGAGSATGWLAVALIVPLVGGGVLYTKYRGQGQRASLLSAEGMSGSEMTIAGPLRLRQDNAAREPAFQQMY